MALSFGRFRLDEPARTLTLDSPPVTLQPRVFGWSCSKAASSTRAVAPTGPSPWPGAFRTMTSSAWRSPTRAPRDLELSAAEDTFRTIAAAPFIDECRALRSRFDTETG